MVAGGGGFIEISFEVVGAAPIQRRLATWGASIRDLSPAWELVADDIEAEWSANFTGEGGGFNSQKWAPLRPATVKDRERHGFPGEHPILVRTGNLRESVTEKSGMGHVREVRPDGLTLGTMDPVAKFHQFGTSRMAARPVVGLSWQMRSKVVQRLGDYVREQARAAGLGAS